MVDNASIKPETIRLKQDRNDDEFEIIDHSDVRNNQTKIGQKYKEYQQLIQYAIEKQSD